MNKEAIIRRLELMQGISYYDAQCIVEQTAESVRLIRRAGGTWAYAQDVVTSMLGFYVCAVEFSTIQ